MQAVFESLSPRFQMRKAEMVETCSVTQRETCRGSQKAESHCAENSAPKTQLGKLFMSFYVADAGRRTLEAERPLGSAPLVLPSCVGGDARQPRCYLDPSSHRPEPLQGACQEFFTISSNQQEALADTAKATQKSLRHLLALQSAF